MNITLHTYCVSLCWKLHIVCCNDFPCIQKWMMSLMHLPERQGKIHPKRVTWWHSRIWKAYLQIGLNLKVWVSPTGSLNRRLLKNFPNCQYHSSILALINAVTIEFLQYHHTPLSMTYNTIYSRISSISTLWCDFCNDFTNKLFHFTSYKDISMSSHLHSTDCWSEISMLWRFYVHSWKRMEFMPSFLLVSTSRKLTIPSLFHRQEIYA